MRVVSSQRSVVSKGVFCFALSALLFALCFPTDAQQQAKVVKLGELTLGGSRFGAQLLRQELRAIGYVEGKNMVFEVRSAEGKLERFPALAEELVRLKVDILVGTSTPVILAFKNATRTIPIVFNISGDPVAIGLVDSLARPGGNITGFTRIGEVLAGKRLELLKEVVPKLSRVALLWDPRDANSVLRWKESQLPARDLGLQLYSMETSSADKYESAFKEAVKAGSDALVAMQGSVGSAYRKRTADLAIKNRLPAIGGRGEFADLGGLMSYGPDEVEPYRRAAVYIDKILKGAKPADLPVEQPTKFEFVVNLKTAKQIGVTIPPNVLARADRIIK